MHKRLTILAALVALLTGTASAGPPLVCHPIDIGTARSLPWNVASGWNGMVVSYNVSQLVSDTIAVLDSMPDTAVQMETLRRAAIYSSRNPDTADELARRLFAQHAWFQAGYFVEAVREAAESYVMIHDPAQRAAWRLRTLPPYIAGVLKQHADPAR